MSDFLPSARSQGRLILHYTLVAAAFVFLAGTILTIVVKRQALTSGDKPQQASESAEAASAGGNAPAAGDAQQNIEVIVPVKDIVQGEALQPAFFAKVSRPVSEVPQNALRVYEDVQGKFARVSLRALEPVAANRVTREQPVNIVADSIPPGYRAVTISVNATSVVEGWASPGVLVDVQWITQLNGETVGVALVQNAKVLSAERQVDINPDNPLAPIPTTVTLLVSDRDAQKISLAASTGTVSLHLRGADDPGKSNNSVPILSLNDILKNRSDQELKNQTRPQGTLRVKQPDGSYTELAIINGKVMSKVD